MDAVPNQFGVAFEYVRGLMKAFVTETETTFGLIGGTTTLLAAANPGRIALLIVVTSNYGLTIASNPTITGTYGINLNAPGASVFMSAEEDYTAVTKAWYGYDQALPCNVYVLEVFAFARDLSASS